MDVESVEMEFAAARSRLRHAKRLMRPSSSHSARTLSLTNSIVRQFYVVVCVDIPRLSFTGYIEFLGFQNIRGLENQHLALYEIHVRIPRELYVTIRVE